MMELNIAQNPPLVCDKNQPFIVKFLEPIESVPYVYVGTLTVSSDDLTKEEIEKFLKEAKERSSVFGCMSL